MSSNRLQPRELECLHWAALGLSAAQTAQKLNIETSTVVAHRNKAKEKLGCSTLTQAVYECVCIGYLPKK